MIFHKLQIARMAVLTLLAVGSAQAFLPSGAGALAPTPVWKIGVTSQPTNFVAGRDDNSYFIVAKNAGGSAAEGAITLKDTFPSGLVPLGGDAETNDPSAGKPSCSIAAQTITCTVAGPIHPSHSMWITIPVELNLPEGATAVNQAEISGGGAPSAHATATTEVRSSPAPFGFLAGDAGFEAPINEVDGSSSAQAGGHEYQFNVDLGFPTEKPGGFLTGAGHVRDLAIDLPRGLLGSPAATPVRCTEAQLVSEDLPGCPRASQVGVVNTVIGTGVVRPQTAALYNMIPPPGYPAAFAFEPAGVGIFIHVVASVRSDGDYGVSAFTSDVLALGLNPILGASTEVWGDPSAASHDYARDVCLTESTGPCSVDPQTTAFLSLPVDCPGNQLAFKVRADSWEEPGLFKGASYESADLSGETPVEIGGCDELEFKPTIESRPTTNLSDSPSGLDFHLKQPQELHLDGRSTAILKDTTVTLPEGLTVNAAQANGLSACTSAEVGLTTPIGQSPIHFSKAPAGCPDGSKLGTVEATTPLLVQYDAESKVVHDLNGNPVAEPLHGSVYIAKPFDNPFGSLLAIYLVVEDPKTGTVAKLAGRVEPDPVTGQLRTRVTENPEIPLEDVRLHLFTGARAGLQTPIACGSYITSADLTPWSASETPDVHATDSFTITGAPGGGACPSTAEQAPNAPVLNAGTVSPRAGSYSPFVLKLTREDGSQRLAGLDTTLPPGLSARLADVPYCSEAEIAAAQGRNQPNDGVLEQANPSCPAASEVGVTSAGAGAGPTPFYAPGHLYLAGPYKGAPLSFVAITPAVAGPFDLGVVVIRIAVYLDPTTAQGHAVSDPFPTILHGIPLNLRSAAVTIGRPQFTLNPTSCDPMAITGTAISTLGQSASLTERFQVAGCRALGYKPKLHTRLFGPIHRGGHPRLRSVFEAKPGQANTARIVFALPRSEFIDQAHFRTICTRVQFAASQCPPGSIYGHVKAITPLLDYPVEGPIYLRSSSNLLPDVVMALRGPARQPVEIDAVGRVDSVNGGLRIIFQTIPDAPLTKAIVTAQGGKKGLFQNSTNICKSTHRASVKLNGQNGKFHDLAPALKADCNKGAKKKRKSQGR